MRYSSLIASAAMLAGVAACKGNAPEMNPDLAQDLAAARTSDALALAPHAGAQSVVSAAELSPEARVRRQPSASSGRSVAHRTPHRDRVTPAATAVSATAPAPAPVEVATSNPSPAESSPADPAATSAPSPRPQPVDVPYPGTSRGDGNRNGNGGGSSIGVIIGAIGGAILRGGVVDGDHCDPRGRHGAGGGILINQRGPIFRGHF